MSHRSMSLVMPSWTPDAWGQERILSLHLQTKVKQTPPSSNIVYIEATWRRLKYPSLLKEESLKAKQRQATRSPPLSPEHWHQHYFLWAMTRPSAMCCITLHRYLTAPCYPRGSGYGGTNRTLLGGSPAPIPPDHTWLSQRLDSVSDVLAWVFNMSKDLWPQYAEKPEKHALSFSQMLFNNTQKSTIHLKKQVFMRNGL